MKHEIYIHNNKQPNISYNIFWFHLQSRNENTHTQCGGYSSEIETAEGEKSTIHQAFVADHSIHFFFFNKHFTLCMRFEKRHLISQRRPMVKYQTDRIRDKETGFETVGRFFFQKRVPKINKSLDLSRHPFTIIISFKVIKNGKMSTMQTTQTFLATTNYE